MSEADDLRKRVEALEDELEETRDVVRALAKSLAHMQDDQKNLAIALKWYTENVRLVRDIVYSHGRC